MLDRLRLQAQTDKDAEAMALERRGAMKRVLQGAMQRMVQAIAVGPGGCGPKVDLKLADDAFESC